MMNKEPIKRILGELPFTAELYWRLYQSGRPLRGFRLERLEEMLPQLCLETQASPHRNSPGRNVLIFASLPYWIAHTTLLGLVLSGLGHRVTLAYVPYGNWYSLYSRFDLRRHNEYARQVLSLASALLCPVSWFGPRGILNTLPGGLKKAIETLSLHDVQYTLQTEEVDLDGELYRMRLERNTGVARVALRWMKDNRPDVVIVPNGTILELGAVYQVARYVEVPTVTYEFDEQRQHIWMAQNAEVMLQDTDALWISRQDRQLTTDQVQKVRSLYTARQQASLWESYSRRWQNLPSQGSEKTRRTLGLDSRPIVLLAPNVLGDSVTLKRQIFSQNMAEWLERTVRYFAEHSEVQLVVRIHPGEALLLPHGMSMAEVAQRALPSLPDHIHLIEADAKVNTYDLVDIASLGLVYTTTVGLEMAMKGVPVIVCGQTHYRGKGFTLDPDTWDDYFQVIERVVSAPHRYRLSEEQVRQAWNYAYFFFFEYPLPFPWHLIYLWDDLLEWPLARVLSEEGQEAFGDTFRYLAGEPLSQVESSFDSSSGSFQ
jgi:hypothetical protein